MPHKEYCIEVSDTFEGHVVNNNSRWAFVAEPGAHRLPPGLKLNPQRSAGGR